MSSSEDKPSKTNGLGTDPMQRLASFKAPRDLSLGGVKPNKKIFTPNLNVARNKNKGLSSANVRDQKKEDKNRKDRRNDRNKNLKNGPNIIKSSGVFSEGLGSAERHSSRTSYGRDSDITPTLQKPTIRVKDVIKIDKELEEQKIKTITGDSENVEDDVQYFRHTRDNDAPVKLPMAHAGWLNAASKFKREMVIKKEPKDELESAINIEGEDKKPMVDVKEEAIDDFDVVDVLMNDKPTLILLQLPDTLPGRGNSTEDDAPRRRQTVNANEASTSTAEPKEEKPVDNRCRLSDLEEGLIGKLQVHRSGRVSLLLGDTVFEVSAGTKPSQQQEVVSVAADEASRSASLVALGPLLHKLTLTPDWEHLFAQMPV